LFGWVFGAYFLARYPFDFIILSDLFSSKGYEIRNRRCRLPEGKGFKGEKLATKQNAGGLENRKKWLGYIK